MAMKHKWTTAAFIMSGLFLSPSAAAEEENVWRAAYEPELPPFHYSENGEARGFAVDLLEEIAEEENFRVIYEPMADYEAAAALENEEIDLIIGMSYNQDRAENMEFSNAYYSTSIGLFVREEEAGEIDGVTRLTGNTAAVKADSLEQNYLENIRGVQFNETSTLEQAVKLASAERADALAGEITSVGHLLDTLGVEGDFQLVDSYMVPVEYSFAAAAENYEVLRALNNGMRTLQNNGRYQEVFQEWFPEESGPGENLVLAMQILGGALLLALGVVAAGLRINRRLQKEVEKKTHSLHTANLSLKKQIEATKNSNEFQKQILQSSPRGMMTLDKEGKITSYSPKASFMLNTEGNKTGKYFYEDPLLQYYLKDKLEDVLQHGRQFLGEERDWTRDDGIQLRLRAYIYPLYDFEQKIVGVMFTFEDISEEVRVRYQAFENEKNQALSRVVAGIAHEIRNPLTSIKTFAELIPLKFESPRFREKISTLVPQEIERLNELIEGLMDYSKSRPAKKEMLDTSDLLESCFILFERTAENKGVSLTTAIEKNLVILADRQQLKQAVINLIINAIDALAESEETEDKRIVLKNYACGDEVCLVVEDNGPGMSRKVQKQAFEPFYTTKPDGTGLGLAIAKQHVEENNGSFHVESGAGKGTRIQLRFPLFHPENWKESKEEGR